MATSVQQAASIAAQIGVPVLIWGDPGTGKTSFVEAMGEALDLPVETVIASIREPADFAGLPVVRLDSGVDLAPPSWATRLANAQRGILFLDEISTAAPAVQAALLRVVLDRVVGDLVLPDDVCVVAAANPTETAAGGWELSPALANRWLHLDWTLDAKVWRDGIVSGFPTPDLPLLPANWLDHVGAARGIVAAFIYQRPTLLKQVPGTANEDDGPRSNSKSRVVDAQAAGRAWPSPRTWEQVAYLWAAAEAINAPPEVRHQLVCGSVGDGAGIEFLTWQANLDLPDPAEMLAAPTSWKRPDRGDQLYAALTGAMAYVENHLSKKLWLAGWDVAVHASAKQADIAAVAAKSLARMLMARDGAKMQYPQLRGVSAPKAATVFADILIESGVMAKSGQ
jgi:hypothetical protein